MRAVLARFAAVQPRIAAWLAVAAFAAALAVPMAAHLLGAQTKFTLVELRTLAPPPAPPKNVADWKRLPAAVGKYFDDHFGLRPHLINFHLWLGRQLGVSHTRNVMLGKDGWLFFRGDHAVEQYQGIDRFSDATLEMWIDRMEQHKNRLAKRGIPLLVAIAPDPHSIYSEYLPDYVQRVAPQRLDQLIERLKQRPAFELLDLRPALQAAKMREQVYFKTDTHWNSRGAFAGYRAVIEHLRQRFPTMPMLSDADLTRTERRMVFGMGPMLAPRGGIAETDIQLAPRTYALVGTPQVPPQPPRTRGQMPFIASTTHSTAPRVLVIGDSYFGYMMPFFSGSVAKLTWLRHGFVYFPHAEIPDDKYDIAIFIMVQRGLHHMIVPPPPE